MRNKTPLTDARTKRPLLKPSQSKVDITEQKLLSMICSGLLPAGQWLKQHELAATLETSVTPLREALRRLEAAGVVVNVPYQGVKVSEISREKLRQIYLVHSLLQSEAVRLYVSRITEEEMKVAYRHHKKIESLIEKKAYDKISEFNQKMHMIICGAEHFSFLGNMIASLWKQNPKDVFTVMPERAILSAAEHEAILQAIAEKKADLASKLVKRHFLGVGRSLAGDGELYEP
ncbi:MAG: GntR family transcriptional regulator [Deltaproteobacteria bacterium]|nr:GntR family transcriptional regulator [Deltaproteobacteria bacterium]